jgi:predicted RNase H-like HicB family nuclease
MYIQGLLIKNSETGRFYAVEIPALDIHTQGRTKKEAMAMAKDAVEMVIDKKGFNIATKATSAMTFVIMFTDFKAVIPVMLRRLRESKGYSLEYMATQLKQKSINGYARYEKREGTLPNAKRLNEMLEILGRPLAA